MYHRVLPRTDPQWQTYSADQRMMLAAQSAMADVQAEAARFLPWVWIMPTGGCC